MVVDKGDTEKFAPLALVPMAVPPLGTVYQEMLLPAETPFRLVLPPQLIVAGEAVAVGAVNGPTFTTTEVLVAEIQPEPVQESVTAPLPVLAPWVWVTADVPVPV